MDREEVIKGMEQFRAELKPFCGTRADWERFDAGLSMLKKQKQIKSPDEFKSLLLGMFDSIWDVEIDHPVFQDTVGELMEGVLQAYRQAVEWNESA